MVQILNRVLEVPIIQGGMGVGVSLGNLAGNVAYCGGMGVISTANTGFKEIDFNTNPMEANIRALKSEVKKSLEIAKGKGIVAINAMVATSNYEEMIKVAIDAGINAVISGAGLPLSLPKLTKGTKVAAAPIVSSGKAASLICKNWDAKYEVVPDFIVIEGPKAGGHLGFKKEEILEKKASCIENILKDVIQAIKPYKEKYNRDIPVFVAGGVFDGKDMAKYIKQGASGVQMATRFIATKECDASEEYKQAIVEAKEEDITIVNSPVGLPGRALNSPLIKRLKESAKFPPIICNRCIKSCPGGAKTPYCISRALTEAVKGNWEDGLFFCGSNADRVNKITSVKELMEEIVSEWRKNS